MSRCAFKSTKWFSFGKTHIPLRISYSASRYISHEENRRFSISWCSCFTHVQGYNFMVPSENIARCSPYPDETRSKHQSFPPSRGNRTSLYILALLAEKDSWIAALNAIRKIELPRRKRREIDLLLLLVSNNNKCTKIKATKTIETISWQSRGSLEPDCMLCFLKIYWSFSKVSREFPIPRRLCSISAYIRYMRCDG